MLYHLYKNYLQPIADPSKALVSLRGAFHSSPLGNLLRPVFEDEVIKNEAAMNYMNDFLHMMYKPMVEGELQVNVIILGCAHLYNWSRAVFIKIHTWECLIIPTYIGFNRELFSFVSVGMRCCAHSCGSNTSVVLPK